MNWLLIVVSVIHLLLCPYTKVEESFNLQAMHDIIYHQTSIQQYDHLEFPGVVPRSFIGPLVVCGISSPFVSLIKTLKLPKYFSQYIVRAALGALVLCSLLRLKRRISQLLGPGTGDWFVLITLTQFHFVFYLSRPLPNVMALPLVLLAFDFWLGQHHALFIFCSAAAIIIFRGELAVLLGLILFGQLLTKRITLNEALRWAVPAGLSCLFLTVAVDSYFWRRLLWPEGEVLWFNLYLNKSSEWGVMPFWWYFYSAIPRAMAASLLFLPLGLILEKRLRPVVVPALLFVLAYSFLPHKELRFIIYVIPLLNLASAAACSRLWDNRTKSKLRALFALVAVGHLLVNAALTAFLLAVSRTNYPGGEALDLLHRLESPDSYAMGNGVANNVTVHIDVLAAQTGVSRFGQLHDHWRYDKTEHLKPGSRQLRSFTHLIIEAHHKASYHLKPYANSHKILASVEGYQGIRATYHHFPPIRIKTRPSLFILKNKEPPVEPDFSFTMPVHDDDVEQPTPAVEENEEDLDFEFTNHFEGDGTVLPPIAEGQ